MVAPCLEGLLAETAGLHHEVIVVDNGSTDETLALLQTYSGLTLIRNDHNRGVAAARNQGIRRSRGEYILLLDIDAVPAKGAVSRLLQFMQATPSAGLCAPRLVHPDGRLQYSCRRFPTLAGKVARRLPAPWASRLLHHEELRGWAHNEPAEVDYCIGACQLIRRRALEQVGELDERMFYGPEDVDLCIRLWERGWRVYYNPLATVMHHEQRASRDWRRALAWRHAAALAYFFWKHRYAFSRRALYKRIGVIPSRNH